MWEAEAMFFAKAAGALNCVFNSLAPTCPFLHRGHGDEEGPSAGELNSAE